MHNLRFCLVLLSMLVWTPVHAGFLDKLFGEEVVSSSINVPIPSLDMIEAPVVLALRVSDYRLGAGDKLNVSVLNEKDLTMDVRLSDAGSFLYPFLGEVVAKNKTISELQSILTNKLKEGYLVDPKVYVSILEYRPFFVDGEVSRPGAYPYIPGLTVRKAISLAGGLTPRASLTKIFVIHESDPLGSARLTTMNAVLQPGDTITIEQSFF